MSAALIRFDEVRAWIFDKALPLWAGAGLDRVQGGARESLDLQGRDGGLGFKRTRVQARQVYVFSQAALMGWAPGAEAADHCWRFLASARRADGAWPRRLGRAGDVQDPTADAYDIAFVLYALAWRLRAGDRTALAEAHDLAGVLDRLLLVGPGLAWRSSETDPTLDQNPHMHMLEASLELADAGADERFAERAKGILAHFRDRMFDPAKGVLTETFGEGWARPTGDRRTVWPGHHFEWPWLLYRARDVVGMDLSAEAKVLFAFAESRGVDPDTRLADDGLDGEAMTPRRTFRAWNQTEALKANLAMFEHEGLDTRARVAEITNQLLDRYLGVEPAGLWQDRFGPGFAPMAPDVPTSTFYHLLLAFTELLRLEPQLSKGAGPG